jgi:restriction system protein
MNRVDALSGRCTPDDYVVLCPSCGFWFGRGEKDFVGPSGTRGAVGLVSYKDLSELEIASGELVQVLNEHPEWIQSVDPFKAEELVCQLLRDTYGWEVMRVGGRRDKGVDAIAVMSDSTRAIVQIKWRRDHSAAESVRTVRELAGTLLVNGIPSGLLVTTARDLSNDAKREAASLSTRNVEGLGRLDIDWRSYANVLDMLEIASVAVEAPKRVPFSDNGYFHIFDGGGIWDDNWNHLASSFDLDSFGMATDPYEIAARGTAIDDTPNDG